jgi:hypothetical protein
MISFFHKLSYSFIFFLNFELIMHYHKLDFIMLLSKVQNPYQILFKIYNRYSFIEKSEQLFQQLILQQKLLQ